MQNPEKSEIYPQVKISTFTVFVMNETQLCNKWAAARKKGP